MKYHKGDLAILNEKVLKGLPSHVGDLVEILRVVKSNNFDYEVELANGDINPVKEDELNELTEEQKQQVIYIKRGNTVIYTPASELCTIRKIDMLHGQIEVDFLSGGSSVVGLETLRKIGEKESDKVKELTVDNSVQYKELLQEKYDVYVRKNKDYGNSFEEQYNEYGLLSAIIRLDDKLRRLKQLRENKANVKDESIRDTALDLANYADMLVMVLDKGVK